MKHIIPISGKDSLATALIQMQNQPDLEYSFLFNPTGQELPVVFEWLENVERTLNIKINHIGEDLKDMIEYEYNWFLPSRLSRYCTRRSKIEPMEKWIGKDECYVYYGIRADEKRIGYVNNRYPHIIPKYPLIDNGIGIDGVYEIIHKASLKPPMFFWQRLYNEVVQKVGEDILLTFKEYEIDKLFCWRTRANCAMCFNQTKYEWIGLLEHYPDMFREYESWEHNVSEYYFNGKDMPLAKIREQKDIIFKKRVEQVARFIESRKQYALDFGRIEDDFLSTKSCGLFCGK